MPCHKENATQNENISQSGSPLAMVAVVLMPSLTSEAPENPLGIAVEETPSLPDFRVPALKQL